MADPARARKLAVRIRQIVSAAIEMQIKDPRLGMVTVTDAKVTGDLREATVFYTVYGDETQIADSADGAHQRDRRAALDGRQADRHQVRADADLRRRHRPGHRPRARGGPRAGPARRRRAGPRPRGRAVRRRGRPLPQARRGRRRRGRRREPTASTRSGPTLPMTVSTTCPSRAGAHCERSRPRPERARGGPATLELGGREVPGDGDPTDGGKHGEIGEAPEHRRRRARRRHRATPSAAAPSTEERDAPPVADPARTPDPVTVSSRAAPRPRPPRGRRRPRPRPPTPARPSSSPGTCSPTPTRSAAPWRWPRGCAAAAPAC